MSSQSVALRPRGKLKTETIPSLLSYTWVQPKSQTRLVHKGADGQDHTFVAVFAAISEKLLSYHHALGASLHTSPCSHHKRYVSTVMAYGMKVRRQRYVGNRLEISS